MEGLVFLPVLLSTTKLPTHLLKLVELVTVIATSVQEETPTFIAPTVSQLLSAMEELVSLSVPLSTTRLLPPLPRLVELVTVIVTSVLEIRTTIVQPALQGSIWSQRILVSQLAEINSML